MKATFKIQITTNYQLKCSIIDDNNKETIITLPQSNQQEITPSITFSNYTISLCEKNTNEKENTQIEFMKNWIEHPESFSTHQIVFQNKEYSLLPEVLFSLIIREYKTKIEKEFIIDQTIIQMPSRDFLVFERIKTSLEAIGLKNIFSEMFSYDYSQQEEMLNELIQKKEIVDNQKRIIERAKELQPLSKDKLNKIDFEHQEILTEEMFNGELSKRFTTKQREEMKLFSLDNYCIFIASRYLENVEDHINLVKVSKRMRGNMEKFHYNPISLDETCVDLFPNVETFHLYNGEEEYIKGGRIQRYVNWNPVSYYESEKMKDKNKGKEIEFKRIIWTKEDMDNLITSKNRREENILNSPLPYLYNGPVNPPYFVSPSDALNFKNIEIPKGIHELKEKCFDTCVYSLENLFIPATVKVIPKNIVENCWRLTNIALPLNDSQMIIGNKIFNTPHLEQFLYLPENIKIINGKDVDKFTSLEIPTTVTSINWNDFDKYKYKFHNLVIPTSVTTIPNKCIQKCTNLTNISLPLNESQMIIGNKIFNTQEHLEQHVYLPDSIKIINGQEVEKLISFEIPTTVISLDEDCFNGCDYLKELTIPTTIKTIPKYCIEECEGLTNITLPLNESQVVCGGKIFSIPEFKEDILLPNSIIILNGKYMDNTTMSIPTTATSIDWNIFDNNYYDNLKQLSIPETIHDIPNTIFKIINYVEELILPSHFKIDGNLRFYVEDGCLYSVPLPSSIHTVNGDKIKSLESFTIPSSVTKLSKECFEYCDKLSEIEGLEQVKEIEKYCFYNTPLLDREKYPQIKISDKEYIKTFIKEQPIQQLEEWTGLECCQIIFDSSFDDWTTNKSVFHKRIIGKSKLVFIIEDNEGEIFGYYLNTEITKRYHEWRKTDDKSFEFNLESNGRLTGPMKFEIKNEKIGGWKLFKKYDEYDDLIVLGDIHLKKKVKKYYSYCEHNEYIFNYHEIDFALCGKGKIYNDDESGEMTCFDPKNIYVIQMN